MNDNGAIATSFPGRRFTVVVAVLATIAGLAAVGVILGLRVTNEGQEPSHLNWWLVAWVVVGVDALAGAALATGQRRLAGCLSSSVLPSSSSLWRSGHGYVDSTICASGRTTASAETWASRSSQACRCAPAGSSPHRRKTFSRSCGGRPQLSHPRDARPLALSRQVDWHRHVVTGLRLPQRRCVSSCYGRALARRRSFAGWLAVGAVIA